MRTMCRWTSLSEAGFTLVEVLVALALVSGVMLALMHERELCYLQALQADSQLTALLLASDLIQESALAGAKEQSYETGRFNERPEFCWEKQTTSLSVEGGAKMTKIAVRVWKGNPSAPPEDSGGLVTLERLITP